MRLPKKEIATSLFGVYYIRAKKYQPSLKLGTYGGKVVGTKLGKVMIHIKLRPETRKKHTHTFCGPIVDNGNTFSY